MKQSDRPPRLFRQCWPVVWLAGRIVPADKRQAWYGRWRHTIWHWAAFLEENDRVTASSQYELVQHCWAAFGDAFWVRFDRDRFLHRCEVTLRAPSFVLATALALLVALALASGGFYRTRQMLLPQPVPAPSQMGTIQYLGEWWSLVVSAVPDAWVQTWQKDSHSIAGIAEYSLEEPTLTAPNLRLRVGAARVAPGFFDLTRATPAAGRFFHESEGQQPGRVVISYELWQQHFHRRANVIGTPLELNGEKMTVIGVAPRGFWMPALGTSAWVQWSSLPVGNTRALWPVGAIVRLKDEMPVPVAERELEKVIREYGRGAQARLWTVGSVQIAGFQGRARQSLATFGIIVMVALLATLVAGLTRFRPHRARIGLWTGFLALKTFVLLAVCALACIEATARLARLTGHAFDSSVWGLDLWICLVLSVAVLVWSLHDQRYRCPVCLTRMEMPVLVGEPSHMLFGFGATEFVCPRGHGLLHISDSHCSWIDPEEWTGLDASWQNLFDDTRKE